MLDGSILGFGGAASEDDKLNDQGFAAMQAGNMGEAEHLFREALIANPDNPYALLNLGVLLQDTGRHGLAREAYQRLLATDDAVLATRVGDDPQEAASLKVLAERNLELLPPDPRKQREAERKAREEAAAREMEERKAAEAREKEAEERRKQAHAAAEDAADKASQGAKDSMAGAEGGFRVHLASYKNQDGAEKGWAVLSKKHPKHLGNRSHDIVRADLGAEKGVFFRVFAVGFPGEADAAAACGAIKRAGDYCKVFGPE